ncbi:MAG: thioesterase family protein [Gordonia sp. (in: high G+C Gram-positive bacteria)]|uniref:acyl-CoA thioesterase n=1 Tax=Gordonia sp. (in: high G+C Gram-positive bacteria) TaxID=84139 RepID=UPI0039E50EE7
MSETSKRTSSDSAPHVVPVALRWGDMDSLGHVNNVQFARLFEEARVRSMNDWFDGDRGEGIGMVVAHQEIEFAAPLYYSPEPAQCEIRVSRIGGKSFDFAYRLTAADGTVGAIAETTITVLDLDTGRPTPLSERAREVLERHLGEPAPFRRRR